MAEAKELIDGGEGLAAKLEELRSRLRGLEKVVVAFSGGCDSGFLAWEANRTLGRDQVLCVTAVSGSLAPEELADCEALAKEWNLRWIGLESKEVTDPRYIENGADRCFHCKTELMNLLAPLAVRVGGAVVLGVNVDDLGDHRPGQEAASEQGAVFPLVQAGLTKPEIRRLAKDSGLRIWDKPAAACLASRVPYGSPVTLQKLSSVSKAESALRKLGFSQLRVRHFDETARIEVEIEDMPKVLENREAIVDSIMESGYRNVMLDLRGFRSGSLNESLQLEANDVN